MSHTFEKKTVKRDRNYTTIYNGVFKAKDLSLKAKGLLGIMLSLPEDSWEMSIDGLASLSKDGKESVKSAIKELETAGYLTREAQRSDDGKFNGYLYTIYEKPLSQTPSAELPSAEIPSTENSTQLNTYIINTQLNKYSKNKILNNNPPTPLGEREYHPSPKVNEMFKAYLEERKSNRTKNTDRAINLLLKKLNELAGDNDELAIKIIENAIMNGWKSFYPINNKKQKSREEFIDEWANL